MKYLSNMLEFMIKLGYTLACFISVSSMAQVNDPGAPVYMSVDRGVNWEKAGVGLPADASINVFAVKENKVIAGTNSHGIYISDDRVKSWYPSSSGLPKNVRITALIYYKNSLFVGTYLNGIYFSNDDGANWNPVNTGLTNLTIRSFYTSGTFLLVGTNDGIYRTSNGGVSWSAEKKGVQINSFAASGQALYAATNTGVFTSADFGKTWHWIYKDGAIYKMSAGKKEIYLLDFSGDVYQSAVSNFVWIKTDIYLPFRYTFQLTPSSRRFFNVDWKNSFRNLGSFDQDLRFYGLPEKSAFSELLETPFGLLASVASKDGC